MAFGSLCRRPKYFMLSFFLFVLGARLTMPDENYEIQYSLNNTFNSSFDV